VLAGGSLVLSKVTQELVLDPIENMIKKVKEITDNPIKAAQEAEEEQVKQEEIMAHQNEKDTKKGAPLETEMLEKTLSKIGSLLAVGFGEAGSQIISENVSKGDEINPMIPGRKTIAVFGFCDIRNFTDATEVLQEGVMLFVNEIGEIVHGIVDKYMGTANKNIGDAFLLVWKFEEECIDYNEMTDEVALKRSAKTE